MARAVLTRTPEGLVVWRPIHSRSVEQFAQKALAAALMAPLVAVLSVMIAMAAIVGYSETNAAQRPSAVITGAALNDLIEFAAIEPDAATLRTIVDLNALPLAHDKIDATRGAQQPLGRTAIYHDGFLSSEYRPVSRWRRREEEALV